MVFSSGDFARALWRHHLPSSTPSHIPGYSPSHDEPETPVSVCTYPSYKSSVSDVRLFMLSSVLSTTTLDPLVATTHRQSLSEVISPLLYVGSSSLESMPHEMKPLRYHCSTSGDFRTYVLMDILLASSQILPGSNDDDETMSKSSIHGRTISPTPKRLSSGTSIVSGVHGSTKDELAPPNHATIGTLPHAR